MKEAGDEKTEGGNEKNKSNTGEKVRNKRKREGGEDGGVKERREREATMKERKQQNGRSN